MVKGWKKIKTTRAGDCLGMSTAERNRELEDRIVTIALNNPAVLLTKSYDLEIFTKWRKVVAVIITQLNNGISPSVATISQALPELTESQEIELCELVWDERAKKDNFGFFIEQLEAGHHEIWVYRSMMAIINSISQDVKPSDALAKIGALALCSGKSSINHTCDSKGLIEAVETRMKEIEGEKGRYSITTGIEKLDRIYKGLQPGRLVVVGANSGVGKTSFAVTVMSNMARQGYKVGLFSTEQPRDEIGVKLLALLSGISTESITDGVPDWEKLKQAKEEILRQNIFVCDKESIKVSEIAMQCQSWIALHGLDFVVIDYLTRLKPEKETNESAVYRVGRMVAEVKNIARNLKIPVLLLSQLNRAADGKIPTKANLRDSGVIEQESDSILLLSRPTEDDKTAMTGIIVEKNRHGIAGKYLTVEFHGETQRWY